MRSCVGRSPVAEPPKLSARLVLQRSVNRGFARASSSHDHVSLRLFMRLQYRMSQARMAKFLAALLLSVKFQKNRRTYPQTRNYLFPKLPARASHHKNINAKKLRCSINFLIWIS